MNKQNQRFLSLKDRNVFLSFFLISIGKGLMFFFSFLFAAYLSARWIFLRQLLIKVLHNQVLLLSFIGAFFILIIIDSFFLNTNKKLFLIEDLSAKNFLVFFFTLIPNFIFCSVIAYLEPAIFQQSILATVLIAISLLFVGTLFSVNQKTIVGFSRFFRTIVNLFFFLFFIGFCFQLAGSKLFLYFDVATFFLSLVFTVGYLIYFYPRAKALYIMKNGNLNSTTLGLDFFLSLLHLFVKIVRILLEQKRTSKK